MDLFRSLGSRYTLNIPLSSSTVTKGFTHSVGTLTGSITSNLIIRSNSDLTLSRRAMGTLYAGETVGVTSSFTDVWWIFGKELISPKQSLNSAKKFGKLSCVIFITR